MYVPVGYMTVYLGTWNPPRTWIISSGDYSYGIYLFSFPIQQALRALNVFPTNAVAEFLVAFPASLAAAFLSWHLVEKRMLRLRPLLHAAERAALRVPVFSWHSNKVFKEVRSETHNYSRLAASLHITDAKKGRS